MERLLSDRVSRHVEYVAVGAEGGQYPFRVLQSLVFASGAGGAACSDSLKVEPRAIAFDQEVGMAACPRDRGVNCKPVTAPLIGLMEVKLPEGPTRILPPPCSAGGGAGQ